MAELSFNMLSRSYDDTRALLEGSSPEFIKHSDGWIYHRGEECEHFHQSAVDFYRFSRRITDVDSEDSEMSKKSDRVAVAATVGVLTTGIMNGIGAAFVKDNPHIGRYIVSLGRYTAFLEQRAETSDAEHVEDAPEEEDRPSFVEKRTIEAESYVRRPGSLLAELEEQKMAQKPEPKTRDLFSEDIRLRCLQAAEARRSSARS